MSVVVESETGLWFLSFLWLRLDYDFCHFYDRLYSFVKKNGIINKSWIKIWNLKKKECHGCDRYHILSSPWYLSHQWQFNVSWTWKNTLKDEEYEDQLLISLTWQIMVVMDVTDWLLLSYPKHSITSMTVCPSILCLIMISVISVTDYILSHPWQFQV